MTPTISTRPPNLIVERLRLEAALRHRDLIVRVEEGILLVEALFGDVPLMFSAPATDCVRVSMRVELGTCADPDPELRAFVNLVNEREDSVAVEIDAEGALHIGWHQSFEGRIECALVCDGLSALGAACQQISRELRERFFVPSASNSAALDFQ